MERSERVISQYRKFAVIGFFFLCGLQEFDFDKSERPEHGKCKEDRIEVVHYDGCVAENEFAKRAETQYPYVDTLIEHDVEAPLNLDR